MSNEEEEKESKRPSIEIIHELLHGDDLDIPELGVLSDMEPDLLTYFKEEWVAAANDRRHAIGHHLKDMTEYDYSVDFEPIFSFMLDDTYAEVRIAALTGLWDSENISLIPSVLQMAYEDEDTAVRVAAIRALTHYVIFAQWEITPEDSADVIVSSLIELHDRGETDVSLQSAILEAISASPNTLMPEMIENAYSSEHRQLRMSAIFAMGNTADERWLPILREEMESRLSNFRAEAARAVGGIGKEEAAPALINLLIDEDEDVVAMAIQALGEIGGKTANQALYQLNDDPDYEQYEEIIDEALETAQMLHEIEHMELSHDSDHMNGHHH